MNNQQNFVPPVGLTAQQRPRSKQAVLRPTRMSFYVRRALGITPLPALVVQFDMHRNIRSFPVGV